MNYGKIDGDSLALLTGIHSKMMYLYGTKVTIAVDHEPLAALYNSQCRLLPFRVGKFKSKRCGFKFNTLSMLYHTS